MHASARSRGDKCTIDMAGSTISALLLLLGWVQPSHALDRGTVLVTGASRGIGYVPQMIKTITKDINLCL